MIYLCSIEDGIDYAIELGKQKATYSIHMPTQPFIIYKIGDGGEWMNTITFYKDGVPIFESCHVKEGGYWINPCPRSGYYFDHYVALMRDQVLHHEVEGQVKHHLQSMSPP